MAFAFQNFSYQGNSQDMKKVQNYLYMLNEQLRYALSNISFEDMTQNTQDDFSKYFQLTYKNDSQLTQFRVDVDGISATVKKNYDDLTSSISAVRQTATEISQTVAKQYGELTTDISNIRQTATEITQTVQKNYEDLTSSISAVRQTATEISQTVSSNYDSLTTDISQLRQTATEISQTVSNNYNSLTTDISQVRQTASEISSEVASNYNTLNSAISQVRQTATEISQTVSSNYNSLTTDISQVRQTASEISSTVSKNYNSLNTSISEVRQTANKISWLVASGTSSTNFTLTSRMASLVASSIDLTGFVTFSSLSQSGKTTINGDNITTGSLDVQRITANGTRIIYYSSGILNLGGESTSNKWQTVRLFADSAYIWARYIYIGGATISQRIYVGGSGEQVGFLGATPQSRKSMSTLSSSASLTTAVSKINDIINAFVSYGLFS